MFFGDISTGNSKLLSNADHNDNDKNDVMTVVKFNGESGKIK